jgi:hypothetical protein
LRKASRRDTIKGKGLKIIAEDEKLQIWRDGLAKIHPKPEESHGMYTTPFLPVLSAYDAPPVKRWITTLAALEEQ